MTFTELDRRIRSALPNDNAERREILQGLHSIEEGTNFCTNFFFAVSGYKLRDDGSWIKEDHPTMFQVQV